MTDNHHAQGLTTSERIQNLCNVRLMSMVGEIILQSICNSDKFKTPYYMKLAIKNLECELIEKTCEVNEEIIRP